MRAAPWFMAALLCLQLAVMPPAPPEPAAIVIRNDGGGQISTFLSWYHRLAAAGVHVRIEGPCLSACTLVLAMPKGLACVTDKAVLGFHEASVEGKANPDITALLVSLYYPPAVQKWIKDNGPLTTDILPMDAKTVVELGILPYCK